jgi:DNA-binding transcriptional MerR regulator
MSRRERIDALLEYAKGEIEPMGAEALGEIHEAHRAAGEKASRYEEAVEGLTQAEARLERLVAKKEGLPIEHSRAVLADDVDEELRLKDLYAEVVAGIADLEERRDVLKRELAELLPRGRGHDLDPVIHATTTAARVASEARADLEHLKKGLEKILASSVAPVVKEHTDLLGLADSYNRTRDWDLSPAGRGALH